MTWLKGLLRSYTVCLSLGRLQNDVMPLSHQSSFYCCLQSIENQRHIVHLFHQFLSWPKSHYYHRFVFAGKWVTNDARHARIPSISLETRVERKYHSPYGTVPGIRWAYERTWSRERFWLFTRVAVINYVCPSSQSPNHQKESIPFAIVSSFALLLYSQFWIAVSGIIHPTIAVHDRCFNIRIT